ncbi:MAG: histidine--tRNA ligase [Candidatus Paceibacterota bacterium]|jgi:histidyl-tRNA synthetase
MPTSKKDKKESFSSPKGMRDIMDKEYYDFQGLFEKAQEIAIYYGFKPIEIPILEKTDVFTASVGIGTDIIDKEMYTLKTKGGDHLAMRPEGTAGAMRAYIEHGMQSWPQPVMLYYYGPFFRHENPQRGRFRQFYQFGLEVLGSDKSIADAIVIRTAATILNEAGFDNLTVEVNSIGDNACRPAYIRELTGYYKKHIDHICANCKDRLKENPLRLLDCKSPKCLELKENAPDSISYLCNECKTHFKEVLEHLEEMGLPYRINKNLVRGLSYYTKTVFEIMEVVSEGSENNAPKDAAEGEVVPIPEEPLPLTIAAGGRYDYLAKSLGSKKDVPSVGVSIGIDRIVMSPHHKKLSPRILKKPKVYFIQLGIEAKLKSLAIIEVLRKARVPIMQSLSKDSITVQLGTAERLSIPYVIIFGQKEALEGTVLVREMENRSQESVKIEDLAEYLKKMK